MRLYRHLQINLEQGVKTYHILQPDFQVPQVCADNYMCCVTELCCACAYEAIGGVSFGERLGACLAKLVEFVLGMCGC